MGHATETAEIAAPALPPAETVKSAPDTSDHVSGVAIEAEHHFESRHGATEAANSGEVDRPKQPDIVLPPAKATAAAPAPPPARSLQRKSGASKMPRPNLFWHAAMHFSPPVISSLPGFSTKLRWPREMEWRPCGLAARSTPPS